MAVLKEMNRLGGRKVPADAPTGFVPARYAGYLEKARKSGEDTAYRHYWELCVTLCLRDGLRSGDVFVPGSRRYADPSTYLYTPRQWAPRQEEYCRLVGKPAAAAHALEQGTARNMVVHGGQVLSTYTHVSDQWSTYGTKIIVPTAREAHFVLDDFLGNATDLPVTEHATDTHGATLINFALFDLVGKASLPGCGT